MINQEEKIELQKKYRKKNDLPLSYMYMFFYQISNIFSLFLITW